MMKRDLALRALAKHVPNDIVVAVYSAAFDWVNIRPHELNYFSVGAMGLGSSHALGLALGRPNRKVIVIDGDGSLLMNLGSLVTIGNAAPANLYHFVNENGTYEVNGEHPIPGKGRVGFAGLARSAGYASVFEFSDLAEFDRRLPEVLAARGPVFAVMKVVPGERPTPDFDALYHPSRRRAFKAAMERMA